MPFADSPSIYGRFAGSHVVFREFSAHGIRHALKGLRRGFRSAQRLRRRDKLSKPQGGRKRCRLSKKASFGAVKAVLARICRIFQSLRLNSAGGIFDRRMLRHGREGRSFGACRNIRSAPFIRNGNAESDLVVYGGGAGLISFVSAVLSSLQKSAVSFTFRDGTAVDFLHGFR